MTCYIPPPYRPSRIRRIAGFCAGVLALTAIFCAIGLAMFILSAVLDSAQALPDL